MRGAAIFFGSLYALMLVALVVGFGRLAARTVELLPPGWLRAVAVLVWAALGLPVLLLCALVALTIVLFFWDGE